MKFNLKTTSAILVSVLTISSVVTLLFNLDGRWAKAAELKKVQYRLEQKIQQDRIDALQERLWKYDDRYEKVTDMPQHAKDEYRELKKEKAELKVYIEKVLEKTKSK